MLLVVEFGVIVFLFLILFRIWRLFDPKEKQSDELFGCVSSNILYTITLALVLPIIYYFLSIQRLLSYSIIYSETSWIIIEANTTMSRTQALNIV